MGANQRESRNWLIISCAARSLFGPFGVLFVDGLMKSGVLSCYEVISLFTSNRLMSIRDDR